MCIGNIKTFPYFSCHHACHHALYKCPLVKKMSDKMEAAEISLPLGNNSTS